MSTTPVVTRYLLDGIEVTLTRNGDRAYWACSACEGRCEHIVKAAAWVTLQRWQDKDLPKPH